MMLIIVNLSLHLDHYDIYKHLNVHFSSPVVLLIIIFLQVHGHHPPPEAAPLCHHHKGGDCPDLDGCSLSGFPSVLLQRDEILLPQDRMYGGLAWRLWRKTSIKVKKKRKKS